MLPVWFTVLTVAVFFAMEGVAWWTHRYVMHGPLGWVWHRDHHQPHGRMFEVNDLYGVLGAISGFGLFVLAWWTGLWWVRSIALGVTLYGLVYGFVHDGLVHQRWPFRWMPRNGYARRLVQAHKLHHAVQTRQGAVSFGFVIAPNPHRLNAILKSRRAARVGDANAPLA